MHVLRRDSEKHPAEETLDSVNPQSATDILLLALAKEEWSFALLPTAGQSCTDPVARHLHNHLALDELKHLLTLVSSTKGLTDGLADDWLAQLDLPLPLAALPDPQSQTKEAIVRFVSEKQRSQSFFGRLAKGGDQEELLSLLDSLRADEEQHLSRLHQLLREPVRAEPSLSAQHSH